MGDSVEVSTSTALCGKKVVVVGGTSGMGLGTARAAASQGAEVVVVGRRALEARPVELERVEHRVADVTDEASVRLLMEELGPFDHLLVTAAPGPAESFGLFLDQDMASAQSFMNAKFFGSWACARHGAPRIREGGSITFLTGCNAVKPGVGAAMVSASFAALEALARALALELAPLRVNAIRPGLVASDLWSFLEPTARQRFFDAARQRLPVRRVGTVDDIGHAAIFLMTNPYVSGSILEVAGGETLVSLPSPVD